MMRFAGLDMPGNRDLGIVAVIFTIAGMAAALHILLGAFQHRLNADLGIIGLWIGAGLRARNPRAWSWARVAVLFSGGVGIIALTLALFGSPAEFKLFGITLSSVSQPVAILGVLAGLAFTIWQWRVLHRPDVRQLFE